MSKHTPGPWEYRLSEGGRHEVAGGAPRGGHIHGKCYVADCMISAAYRSSEETQANARLIAAAPELLSCLHWAEAQLSAFPRDELADMARAGFEMKLGKIRAAIAKAEGGDS